MVCILGSSSIVNPLLLQGTEGCVELMEATHHLLLAPQADHRAQRTGELGLLVPPHLKGYGNEKKWRKPKQDKSQSQNMSCLVGLRLTQGLTASYGVYEEITGCLLIIWLPGSNNMPKFLQLCLLRALIILNAMIRSRPAHTLPATLTLRKSNRNLAELLLCPQYWFIHITSAFRLLVILRSKLLRGLQGTALCQSLYSLQ